jgi:predicted small metal-binding protein
MDDRKRTDTVTVRCVCGWEVRGSEDEVIAVTFEHGERLHNMSATRQQILAMAVRAEPARVAANPGDAPS